jgi:hypothetical protein
MQVQAHVGLKILNGCDNPEPSDLEKDISPLVDVGGKSQLDLRHQFFLFTLVSRKH